MNTSSIDAATHDNIPSEQARREQAVSLHAPQLHNPADHAATLKTSTGIATGGGAVAGAVAGAAIGTAVGGPAGTAVGGVVGAVTGALGGVAASSANPPDIKRAAPGPQERDVTRFGEAHREDLRR